MINVLLVDDEALTLELHREFVARLPGFRVTAECASARAAVSAIVEGSRTDPIDLVLLDMTMPDGSGLDVLRHIRARAENVDVIAITAVRDAAVVRSVVALGVQQYLVKPFTFAVFRDRMEQYREHRTRVRATSGVATQAEIDAILGAGTFRTPSPLPKGLSEQTMNGVSSVVRSSGPLSSTEVADELGISRVSARRYLEHLVTMGAVVRSARYGTRGRPESEYGWRE